MKSMTGYGSAVAQFGSARTEVVIQSFNRKHLDIQTALPQEWSALEGKVQELVARRISRGRIQIQVTIGNTDSQEAPAASRLDRSLARAVVSDLRDLQEELGIPGDVTLETLLAIPGILRPATPALDQAEVTTSLEQALTSALDDLEAMRMREGKALQEDVAGRLASLQEVARQIESRRADVVTHYHQALQQRLAALNVSLDMADDRLLREVALFADRSDITEETTRLASHLAQCKTALEATTPIGRTLEFLVQEILREVNTIGSKANDAGLTSLVIESKSQIDRLREQLQNIE